MQQAWVHFENLRSAGMAGRSPWVWRSAITVVGLLMLPVMALAAAALLFAGLIGVMVFWVLSAIDRLMGGVSPQRRNAVEPTAEAGRVNVRVMGHNETG